VLVLWPLRRLLPPFQSNLSTNQCLFILGVSILANNLFISSWCLEPGFVPLLSAWLSEDAPQNCSYLSCPSVLLLVWSGEAQTNSRSWKSLREVVSELTVMENGK